MFESALFLFTLSFILDLSFDYIFKVPFPTEALIPYKRSWQNPYKVSSHVKV